MPASTAKKNARDLTASLRAIDQHLAEKLPAVRNSLRPPAKARDLARLAKLFGGKLPADLATWFHWHDGQDPDMFQSLIPEANWSAMSAEKVVGTHDALTHSPQHEIMQPWKPTWIPLFENGGGDHLCFDRDGGALIVWYHDDGSRPKAAKDMATLIDRIERGYRRMKKPRGIPMPPDKLRWQKCGVPTESKFVLLPTGTVYRYAARHPSGRSVELKIKLRANRWLECSGPSLDKALDHWRELAASPPKESDGYYSDDINVRWDLNQNRQALQIAG